MNVISKLYRKVMRKLSPEFAITEMKRGGKNRQEYSYV